MVLIGYRLLGATKVRKKSHIRKRTRIFLHIVSKTPQKFTNCVLSHSTHSE